jgi:hypothetical protein
MSLTLCMLGTGSNDSTVPNLSQFYHKSEHRHRVADLDAFQVQNVFPQALSSQEIFFTHTLTHAHI